MRLIAGIALLAGCGRVGDLKPAPGQPLPVKPLMARTTPTPEQLLTPPPYARPDRVDELVKKSEPRRADPFDLPPPSGGAAPGAARRHRPRSRSPTKPDRPRRNDQRVRKAVFPVAGLGTRLLPATKSIPKEMITIVDRPLIQYAVDEAREAGIEQMIFVTGRGKSALVDYFDIGFELEATMRERGKSLDALEPSRAALRRDRHRPPAAAARPRPCGLVRARHRRRRAVRGAAARRSDGRRAAPGADGRGVGRGRRQPRRRPRKCAAEKTALLRRDRLRARPKGDLTEVRGLVEKPAPADAPSRLADRPLHPPARGDAACSTRRSAAPAARSS